MAPSAPFGAPPVIAAPPLVQPVVPPVSPAPMPAQMPAQNYYSPMPVAAPVVRTPRPPVARGIFVGGLLTLIGGVAAVLSSFLPMLIYGDSLFNAGNWVNWWGWGSFSPADLIQPNGKYMLIFGIVAAAFGLLVMAGMLRGRMIKAVTSYVAMAVGAILIAFSYWSYYYVSKTIDLAASKNSATLTTMGFGVYVAIAGGIALLVGALILAGAKEAPATQS